MGSKTYTAYVIRYGEQLCGCPRTDYFDVYDRTGNKPQQFNTYEEAKTAAIALMVKLDYDNWKVI